MKSVFKWLISIVVFFIMLPISYFLSSLMLLWYQGMGFNGIFQIVIVVCLVFGISFFVAKTVFEKL